jgi:hypothetical protein
MDKQPLPILSGGRFTLEGVVHNQSNAPTRARVPNTYTASKRDLLGLTLDRDPVTLEVIR